MLLRFSAEPLGFGQGTFYGYIFEVTQFTRHGTYLIGGAIHNQRNNGNLFFLMRQPHTANNHISMITENCIYLWYYLAIFNYNTYYSESFFHKNHPLSYFT